VCGPPPPVLAFHAKRRGTAQNDRVGGKQVPLTGEAPSRSSQARLSDLRAPSQGETTARHYGPTPSPFRDQ
jgi:hypothetical protein